MATETYWCPGPLPWEWFRTCTREVPDPPPPDPCNAPACKDAKAKLDNARSRFTSICNGMRSLRAVEKILTPIVNTPIWLIVLFLIIGAIIGGPIAVVIFGLIVLYGVSWLLLFVIGRMFEAYLDPMHQAQTDIGNAINDVIANCPENCRGDLSVPQCDLD